MVSPAATVFWTLLALSLCFRPALAAAEPQSVRLELVLAVDCSSSVTEQEFQLQMQGIAGAFEDPAVLAAIEDTAPQGIAVSLLQWSSKGAQVMALDWTLVAGTRAALALAQRLRAMPRLITGGATAMNTAMIAAALAIQRNDFEGERKAIDVSGDGRANEGESPALARQLANQAGIIVNGLAILNEEPDLAGYYAAWVVGGPGSFLLTANDFEDFAAAMQRKLYFEITGAPIAAAPNTGLLGARQAFQP